MKWYVGYFRFPVLILLCSCLFQVALGQDTLPSFTAVRRTNNRVLISWTNPYGQKIRQLSIQRSKDSLRQFKSIMTLPDPVVLQNGYVDTRSPDTSQYYRLYILLDSGRYIFSTSRKPVKYIPPPPPPPAKKPEQQAPVTRKSSQAGVVPPRPVVTEEDRLREKLSAPEKAADKTTGKPSEKPSEKVPEIPPPVLPPKENNKPPVVPVTPPVVPEKIYQVKRGDTLKAPVRESLLKRFRDSVTLKTKDTMVSVINDTLIIRPFVPKETFKVSRYVFTDKTGLLHIELPDAATRNYKVRFYEEDKSFLFEVKDIRDQILLLDKANFHHAGWFLFELYEDGNLKEKNRFFIGKDF
ncbi:hypothetical protein [Flavihumibacter petaseus]|uniref:Uncharacterized protein n=1 Tax=Flavihumibacter petaseus NBRC 106054 TaxID=1220578 RepID=A0A0E9N1U3_9BACT|nr:hypothetical protein [Flavihumibacter petaseus]GAO43601.1 hypothetical protein FPE01S_02_07070 [Flavihumibacter petaseus NBRC 106054]